MQLTTSRNASACFPTLFFCHGFFRQNRLNLAFFSFLFGAKVCLASVGVDDVRDVVNVSSAEVPDVKVLKMVKRAEVTLELENGQRNLLQLSFIQFTSYLAHIWFILEGV